MSMISPVQSSYPQRWEGFVEKVFLSLSESYCIKWSAG